ncbi:hypothetical protein D9M72_105290 [compost metagenome]
MGRAHLRLGNDCFVLQFNAVRDLGFDLGLGACGDEQCAGQEGERRQKMSRCRDCSYQAVKTSGGDGAQFPRGDRHDVSSICDHLNLAGRFVNEIPHLWESTGTGSSRCSGAMCGVYQSWLMRCGVSGSAFSALEAVITSLILRSAFVTD